MSVRHSLLAILAESPSHGYRLESEFERSTADAWPLNVSQVYTTLGRLERDGLVEPEETDDPARQSWRITGEGREALAGWYATPVVDDPPARDELALKVLLAVAADSVDVSDTLRAQRVVLPARTHVADALGSTNALATLPSEILAMARGDWSPLAETALGSRSFQVPLMALLMDCASGGTSYQLAQIALESEDPANIDSRELMSEEYRSLLQSFLRREEIGSCTIVLPEVRFGAPMAGRTP